MITIKNPEKCCGCTACASVCPTHCIEMRRDAEGFLYPSADEVRCISCGLCESICPISAQPSGNVKPVAYVVQDKRDFVRMSSSSGGAFTAIAEYIVNRNGVVYGAVYDRNYTVIHTCVRDAASLSKFRGSKYVQSRLEDVYSEIKTFLENDEWVLFSGTPCQVAGLKSYLRKEYSTLVTVDLVCHGVPSPMLWEKYLSWWQEKENSELETVEFRSKKYGYSGSTMRLMFKNGHEYSRGAMLQFYKNTMFAGLSLRPSCHACQFKTMTRVSDFTLFDCWDVNAFAADMDDDRGTTAMLVQSNFAKQMLSDISDHWKIEKVDAEKLVANDGDMMSVCAAADPRRGEFFDDLQNMSMDDLNKKYFPMTLKRWLVLLLKPIFYRLGILKKIKRKLK